MSLRNCEEHRHESREKYFQHRKDVFQEVPASLFKWAGKIYQPNNVWCWIASTSTKKNVPPLLPERKQKKNLKIEGTNSLIACTSRLGKQKRFLTDPNFDLGFTRRRTCPATSRSGLCPSRKRPCTATRQPEGAELTPTSRKAQLQQHNPWLPLRSHSHKEIGYTVELLFLPNLQPYVETWTAKITLWNAQNLKRGTSSLQHHQMKNPTTGCSTGRQEETSKHTEPGGTSLTWSSPVWAPVSHELHLPGCLSPGPRPAPEPQFQTWRHHSLVPSRQNEHCHVDVTIGKHN